MRGRAQVIAANNNWNTQVEGGNEDYLAVRNWVVADGANFTARDVLVAEKVCLLGATVARTLFPDGDPVGQIIRMRNMPFRVTGVLAGQGPGAVRPGPGRLRAGPVDDGPAEAARDQLHPAGVAHRQLERAGRADGRRDHTR